MWHLLFFVWATTIKWEDPQIYFCQEAACNFDFTETLNNYKAWEWWKSKTQNGFVQCWIINHLSYSAGLSTVYHIALDYQPSIIQRWIINRLSYKQTEGPIMIFYDPEPADEGDMLTCAAQVQEE